MLTDDGGRSDFKLGKSNSNLSLSYRTAHLPDKLAGQTFQEWLRKPADINISGEDTSFGGDYAYKRKTIPKKNSRYGN